MKNKIDNNVALRPVKEEVKNLITMFDFYMAQRELGKQIEILAESVRDMRIILGRLMMDHFMGLDEEESERFAKALAEMLADSCAQIEAKDETDEEYCRYCIEEMLTPFEYAREIKREFADDAVMQKMLVLDIPILRPFDYGMRGSLKVIEAQKKKRVHI